MVFQWRDHCTCADKFSYFTVGTTKSETKNKNIARAHFLLINKCTCSYCQHQLSTKKRNCISQLANKTVYFTFLGIIVAYMYQSHLLFGPRIHTRYKPQQLSKPFKSLRFKLLWNIFYHGTHHHLITVKPAKSVLCKHNIQNSQYEM